jgi:Flp pilus assembly pilin Flp
MRRVRKTRTRGRSGQGLTEYAILIATVSLGLILLLGSFRNALGNVFRNSRNTLQNNSSVVLEPATSGGGGNTTGGNTTGGNTTGGNTTGGNTTSGPIIFGNFIIF